MPEPLVDARLTVHRLFAETATRCPDRIAVVAGDESLTYAALDSAARRLAARLRAAGAGPDVPVAVLFDRERVASVVAAVAVWQAGACYLPLDPAVPVDRNRRMTSAAEPAAVLGFGAGLDAFRDLVPVAIDLTADAAVAADAPASETAVAYDPASVTTTPDHLAYLVHTSGSTGEPKAVAVPHRALATVYGAWAQCYDLLSAPRVCLQAAGPAFDVHVADLARALLSGGCLVLCPVATLLDPPALAELMATHAVDTVELTPAVLRLFAAGLDRPLPALRLLISGGERMTLEDYAAVRTAVGPPVRIVNSYGVAEAAVDSTWYEIGPDGPAAGTDSVPIGRPFPGVEILVLDEARREVAADAAGELWIAGPTLARGYHRDPSATAARFEQTPDGRRRYRTGDLVRRVDGALVHLGRSDDEVKIRGVRGRLGGVEAVLTSHPAVTAAAVVRLVRAGEPILVAHVVTTAPAADLRTHAAGILPPALVPEIVCHERLPLTPSGKVDRSALTALSTDMSADTELAPTDDVDRLLIAAWTRHLGRPPRHRAENLFEAGGSSLTAASLAASVRESTGSALSTAAVLSFPTITALAREVRRLRTPGPPPRFVPGDHAPLSPDQRRLWLLHTLRPADPAYHLPTVLRLTGAVDLTALRRALDLLVARHDAFRTAFENTADGPIARIRPALGMAWEVIDAADDADADTATDRFIARSFDLGRGAVVRAAVVRRSADVADLVIVAHHAVYDGWSERILLAELGTAYDALLAGAEPALPSLPVRRLDVGRWQAEQLTGAAGDELRAYWRRRLADPPAPLALPTREGTPGAVRLPVTLSADLVRAITTTAAAGGTTPNVVMLSAFAALLARWSGQTDLVVGVPSGDRDDPVTRQLIGFDVATLPIRLAVDPGGPFTALVAQAHTALTEALAHGGLPYDEIVAAARRPGTPLFRVWFNWLGAPVDPPTLSGLDVAVLDPAPPGALFDLGAYVTWAADRAHVDIVYDPGCFERAIVEAFAEQYPALLTALCAATAQPLGEPALTVQTEPADLRGDEAPELWHRLTETAREHADREAVRGPRGALTYREVYDRAAGISRTLKPGSIVGVHTDRRPDLVPALLGVLGAGAAFTVLDAAYPAARLAAQLTAAAADTGLAVTGEVPGVLAGAVPWQQPAESAPPADSAPGPGAVAYIAFTSGTTGTPRGVVGAAEPIAHFLDWYTRRHAIGPGDRVAVLSGLAHDPLLRDILVPLWTGATATFPPPDHLRAPRELRSWLRTEAVTVLNATPALCRLLALPRAEPALPAVRLVCCSGDVLTAHDVEEIRGWAPEAVIVHGYGATETPQLVSARMYEPGQRAADPLALDPGAPGSELTVVDRLGRRTAVGELGEIVVRGPYLAREVLGEPTAVTPDPLPAHRRYATGDLARRLPDGRLALAGRRDDQAKVNGLRFEPAEADRWLRTVPGVADAACAVRPRPDGEPGVIAYLVPAPGSAAPELDAVRAVLRARLPEPLLPSAVVGVPAIPLTAAGKVDRAALPAPAVTGSTVARPALPGAGLERLVANLWQQVLGVAAVPVDRNFFDLGAGSLQLAKVHQALEEALDRRIPIAALFGYATVRSLAAHLAGDADGSGAGSGGIPAESAGPPAPRRPPVTTADLRSRRLAARTSASAKEKDR